MSLEDVTSSFSMDTFVGRIALAMSLGVVLMNQLLILQQVWPSEGYPIGEFAMATMLVVVAYALMPIAQVVVKSAQHLLAERNKGGETA